VRGNLFLKDEIAFPMISGLAMTLNKSLNLDLNKFERFSSCVVIPVKHGVAEDVIPTRTLVILIPIHRERDLPRFEGIRSLTLRVRDDMNVRFLSSSGMM
jgi:hypothetical protein